MRLYGNHLKLIQYLYDVRANDLADYCNVSKSYLSQVSKGLYELNEIQSTKIIEGLGMTSTQLKAINTFLEEWETLK